MSRRSTGKTGRKAGKSGGTGGGFGRGGAPAAVRLYQMKITWETLADPLTDTLPKEVRDRMTALHPEVVRGDAKAVGAVLREMEGLYETYPGAPVLGNWLSMAYRRLGREEDCARVIREVHAIHPESMFARVGLAEEAIKQGDLTVAERLMGREMFLPALYPRRKEFHVTEMLTFGRVAGMYWIAKGRAEVAESTLKLMEELEPDHPATEDLRLAIRFSGPEWSGALRKLGELLQREVRPGQPKKPVRGSLNATTSDEQLELPV